MWGTFPFFQLIAALSALLHEVQETVFADAWEEVVMSGEKKPGIGVDPGLL